MTVVTGSVLEDNEAWGCPPRPRPPRSPNVAPEHLCVQPQAHPGSLQPDAGPLRALLHAHPCLSQHTSEDASVLKLFPSAGSWLRPPGQELLLSQTLRPVSCFSSPAAAWPEMTLLRWRASCAGLRWSQGAGPPCPGGKGSESSGRPGLPLGSSPGCWGQALPCWPTSHGGRTIPPGLCWASLGAPVLWGLQRWEGGTEEASRPHALSLRAPAEPFGWPCIWKVLHCPPHLWHRLWVGPGPVLGGAAGPRATWERR